MFFHFLFSLYFDLLIVQNPSSEMTFMLLIRCCYLIYRLLTFTWHGMVKSQTAFMQKDNDAWGVHQILIDFVLIFYGKKINVKPDVALYPWMKHGKRPKKGICFERVIFFLTQFLF